MQENQFFVGLDMNKNPIKNALGEKVSMSMKVLSSDFSSTNLIKTSEWVIPAGALVTSVTWKPVSTPTSGANNLAIGLQTGSGSLALVNNNKIWLGDSDQTSMFPIDCYVPNDSTLMLSVDNQFYLASIEGVVVVEYALNVEYNALNAGQSKKNVHMDIDGLTSGQSFGCGYRALNQARFPVFGSHPWTAGTNQDKYGYFYYNSTVKKLYIYDSTYTWVTWTGGGSWLADAYHFGLNATGTNCFSDWNLLMNACSATPKPVIVWDNAGYTDVNVTATVPIFVMPNVSFGVFSIEVDGVSLSGGNYVQLTLMDITTAEIDVNTCNHLIIDTVNDSDLTAQINIHVAEGKTSIASSGNSGGFSMINITLNCLEGIQWDIAGRMHTIHANEWRVIPSDFIGVYGGTTPYNAIEMSAAKGQGLACPLPIELNMQISEIYDITQNPGIEIHNAYVTIVDSHIRQRTNTLFRIGKYNSENDSYYGANIRFKNCDFRNTSSYHVIEALMSIVILSHCSSWSSSTQLMLDAGQSLTLNYYTVCNRSPMVNPLIMPFIIDSEVL